MATNTIVPQSMGATEWGLLIGLSILWGSTYFFVGVAVDVFDPLVIVLARVGIAALALNLLLLVLRIPLPGSLSLWRALFIMAILNNLIPFSLMTWGQTHIASGLTAILNASTPLFAVIVAHLFTDDEKLTIGRVLGLVFGFAGVAVLVGTSALRDLGSETVAQLAVISGALSFALAGVFGRRFRRMGVDPLVTAAGQLTASTVVLLPMVALFAGPWSIADPTPGAFGSLVGLALLSTAVAYIIYFRLLASAGAVNLLLVTLLLPVTAVLLGVTFLGEALEPKHLGGMGLIAVGLAAMDGRPVRYCRAALATRTRKAW